MILFSNGKCFCTESAPAISGRNFEVMCRKRTVSPYCFLSLQTSLVSSNLDMQNCVPPSAIYIPQNKLLPFRSRASGAFALPNGVWQRAVHTAGRKSCRHNNMWEVIGICWFNIRAEAELREQVRCQTEFGNERCIRQDESPAVTTTLSIPIAFLVAMKQRPLFIRLQFNYVSHGFSTAEIS